ncbi:NACHT domain- and WD repeat-containing protein 1, partial [Fragariocoptes setiger]
MGAGCSSPLKKFGKRGKRKSSEPYGAVEQSGGQIRQECGVEEPFTIRSADEYAKRGLSANIYDKINEDTKSSEQSLPSIVTGPGGAGPKDGTSCKYMSPAVQALSPDPSSYSPSPAPTPDLIELSENLKSFLLGTNIKTFKSKTEFVENISIVVMTSDYFEPSAALSTMLESVEPKLRSICVDYGYGLRWIDLSYASLLMTKSICLGELSKQILHNEYKENGQNMIVFILTDDNPFKRFILPANIDDSSYNTISNSIQSPQLLKKWYVKKEESMRDKEVSSYMLRSPNLRLSSTTNANFIERRNSEALTEWQQESQMLIEEISSVDTKLLTCIANDQMEFVLNHVSLQKGVFLVRNTIKYSHCNPEYPTTSAKSSFDATTQLSNLTRYVSDSNKLSINNNKRDITADECISLINDWLLEKGTKMIEVIIEENSLECKNYIPMDQNLHLELVHQCHHLNELLRTDAKSFDEPCQHIFKQFILQQLTIQTDNQQSNPLFIVGPSGCGKTTLVAKLIQLCAKEFPNSSHIVYRFAGQSVDSISTERILRSICEQFCQLHGEHISAASRIYSNRRDTLAILSKTLKSSHTGVIIIDGLDTLDDVPTKLDWLAELDLSHRFKLIITLNENSSQYSKVENAYADSCFWKIEYPNVDQLLNVSYQIYSDNSNNTIKAVINPSMREWFSSESKTSETISPQSFHQAYNVGHFFAIVSDLICNIDSHESILKRNSVTTGGPTAGFYDSVIHSIITILESIVGSPVVCLLVIILTSTRYGVTDVDIANLLSSDDKTKESLEGLVPSTIGTTNLGRFPYALWWRLETILSPWLKRRVCDNRVRLSLRRSFSKSAQQYYIDKLSRDVIDVHRQTTLMLYFGKEVSDRSSSTASQKSRSDQEVTDLREHCSMQTKAWNRYMSSELSYLTLRTKVSEAKETLLNRHLFYRRLLYCCTPEEYVEDYIYLMSTLKARELKDANELTDLIGYVRSAIYPIRYDSRQIFSQIYCRAFDAIKSNKYSRQKRIQNILNLSCSPPIMSLVPISEASITAMIRSQFPSNQSHSVPASALHANVTSGHTAIMFNQPGRHSYICRLYNESASKHRLFAIPGNHRHMVLLTPDAGTLVVWDIYDEKPMRSMTGLDNPRDLRMIDQTRAVILCNRELKVYDLDTGELKTKLKGVMPQRSSYFGLKKDEYAVAMSRNRMYVNMINLSTGELETTFKVGEDRFLNSLLVSANGAICVCGDETQKPFPLLVWDLVNRKLLYDLRIAHHEFITRLSAISDDGHYVVSVCKHLPNPVKSSNGSGSSVSQQGQSSSDTSVPNFIITYDLRSGTLFRKWKPGIDTCSIAITMSQNQTTRVINGVKNCQIFVWDLATGAKRHSLAGHSAPVDTLDAHNDRLFSMDSSGRDRGLRIWDMEKGVCLAVFTPDSPVSCCKFSINGDALTCGFASDSRLSTLVLCKNEMATDVAKRNKRRKSSGPTYAFDDLSSNRKQSHNRIPGKKCNQEQVEVILAVGQNLAEVKNSSTIKQTRVCMPK